MVAVRIEWLSDYYDCDTCGGSSSSGANVYFDGVKVISLVPSAHCFGGDNYEQDDVFKEIFEKLGHTLDVGY